MDDTVVVHCPYCFEAVEIYVDPATTGALVEDCEVCCRPWQLYISRDDDGRVQVEVRPAQ